MTREGKRLLINSAVLLVLVLGGLVFWYVVFPPKEGLKIDDTPLQIHSIRTIAEISTVSYKDEVVMDSLELDQTDYSLYDPRKYMDLYNRGVKRRLTLIITGEVRYGVDLTRHKYKLTSNADTVHLILPEPELLDVIIVPSKTEVYLEKGYWSDKERRGLETRAKEKFRKNAEQLKLNEKARENVERMFRKLIGHDRTLRIEFREDV